MLSGLEWRVTVILLLIGIPSLSQDIAAFDDYFGTEFFWSRKSIDVLANDKAAQNVTLSIISYTNHTGMISPPVVNNQTIDIFTAWNQGHDHIVYRICDDSGCDSATLHLSVYLVFSPPRAINDVFVVDTLGVQSMPVLKNDIRANASELSLISLPSYGSAVVAGSRINYVPDNLSFTVDTLEYQICNSGECSSARVYIHCYNPNDPPTLSDIYIDLDEDQAWQFNRIQFQDALADPDDGDTLSKIEVVSIPLNGVFMIDDNMIEAGRELTANELDQLIYTPAADFSGLDSLFWNGTDGALYADFPAKVILRVHPVNDPPGIRDSVVVLNEDESYHFSRSNFQKVFTDIDQDTLSGISLLALPKNGSLTVNGLVISDLQEFEIKDLDDLTYIPSPDFNGFDSLTWIASDGAAFSLESAKIYFEVKPINDFPWLNDIAIVIDEDEVFRFKAGNFTEAFDDPDGDALIHLSFTVLPRNGILMIGDQSVNIGDEIEIKDLDRMVYQPSENYSGPDSLYWNASDGDVYALIPAKVRFDVQPVNDQPEVMDFHVDLEEDEPWLFTMQIFEQAFHDIDGDALSGIAIVSLPEKGLLTIGGVNIEAGEEVSANRLQDLQYLPATNYYGNDEFLWNASDGATYAEAYAKVELAIRPVNDAPIANDDTGLSMPEDSILTVYPLENDEDPEGDDLKIVSAVSENATIEIYNDSLIVRPITDFYGVLTIVYQISDGSALGQAAIKIEVENVDDAPTITDIFIEMEEDAEYQFRFDDFYNAYTDPEGDNLDEISIPSLPGKGSLELNHRSVPLCKTFDPDTVNLTYHPGADYHGNTSFEWIAFSGQSQSNRARVHIQVTQVMEKLIFYEGFSPNNDRYNDQWIIDGIHDYPENEVKIFNRAGLLVYTVRNYDNTSNVWSGETNVYHFNPERLAPDDVYYYIVTFNQGKSIRGSVALKR